MSKKYQLLVAATFWDDHCDRCPCDKGDQGLATEIKREGARVRIEGTREQIQCLYSDADFYAGEDAPDMSPIEIVRSARRVRAVLREKGFE